jgi:endonuclease/exonuclease/phosphatase family metal-dependent hydrolase
MKTGLWRLHAALLLCAFTGCVSLPHSRSVTCGIAERPLIGVSEDGRIASTTVDVLTYNLEGLPNRFRSGRPSALREIGERLAELRSSGQAPHIVMFQEVFSRSARRAVLASGYPSITPGPSARDPAPAARDRPLPGRPNPLRGELGLKLASSGIVIASEFPVRAQARQPFARGSCAGLDCLANKGLVFSRIQIPGVPVTIDLLNTHMNSMGASKVSVRRHLTAHWKQSREAMGFLASHADFATPTIFGGDFNMRASEGRFAEFAMWKPLMLVHRYCIEQAHRCDVRMSWDGDEPWMDTQDLQLFRSGTTVEVRPIRVEAMFDGSDGGPKLSDHDGFLVTYQLSWPSHLTPPAPCG